MKVIQEIFDEKDVLTETKLIIGQSCYLRTTHYLTENGKNEILASIEVDKIPGASFIISEEDEDLLHLRQAITSNALYIQIKLTDSGYILKNITRS